MSEEDKEDASEIEVPEESTTFKEPPTDLKEDEAPDPEEELEDEVSDEEEDADKD